MPAVPNAGTSCHQNRGKSLLPGARRTVDYERETRQAIAQYLSTAFDFETQMVAQPHVRYALVSLIIVPGASTENGLSKTISTGTAVVDGLDDTPVQGAASMHA